MVETQSISILEMATKGGWIMIVLLVLSIIALYLFGKKLWMILSAEKIESNFLNDIKDYLADGKSNPPKHSAANSTRP